MYLVKFTDPEWKQPAVSGTSVRIGSVLHYREIDDPVFRDEDEGDGEIVHQSTVPLDAKMHNKIFGDDGFLLNEGWTIDTGGCKLISQKNIFNPFIFSCSLVNKKSEIPEIARMFGKKSWYFIGDVWKFVDAVSLSLKTYVLNEAMLDPKLSVSDEIRSKINKLEILPLIGRIQYTNDSKEKIVNDSNIDSFDPNKIAFEPFFKKQKRFSVEKEFRMIWVINLGNSELGEFDLSCLTIRAVDLSLTNHGLRSKIKKIKEIRNKRGELIV